jgi:hypothetical protein
MRSRVRLHTVFLISVGLLGCAHGQALRPFDQTVDIPAGAQAHTWEAPLVDLHGHERYRVALVPLWAVEGGIVSFEFVLIKPGQPDTNLLGERPGYSEECQCYPESPFVVDLESLGPEAKRRYGASRRFAIPSSQQSLNLEIRQVSRGHGVGSCESCPRIERLTARVTVSEK